MNFPTFTLEQIVAVEKKIRPRMMSLEDQVKLEGVQLHQSAKGILLPSFVTAIIGNPGAGKSTLIERILTNDELYGKKFERVLFIGPTRYNGLIQDQYNTKKIIDVGWIFKHIDEANRWNCKNMLIVFDDVISTIKSSANKSSFVDLFFNRRHLLENGAVSIIVSGQKWNMIPTFIRTACSMLFLFNLAKQQCEVIGRQVSTAYPPRVLQEIITSLKKFSFILINLEDSTVFNHQWQQL